MIDLHTGNLRSFILRMPFFLGSSLSEARGSIVWWRRKRFVRVKPFSVADPLATREWNDSHSCVWGNPVEIVKEAEIGLKIEACGNKVLVFLTSAMVSTLWNLGIMRRISKGEGPRSDFSELWFRWNSGKPSSHKNEAVGDKPRLRRLQG